MKEFSLKNIRFNNSACSLLIITILLLTLFYHCYIKSYAQPIEMENAAAENVSYSGNIFESVKPSIERSNAIVVKSMEEIKEKMSIEKTVYDVPETFVNPESGKTVKYKGGKTIERTQKITYGELGYINELAEPDEDGFMKLDDRYLIAIGSRFNAEPGQYIDVVLENGVVINCIMGDAKADVDTDATNTFTYKSRCCSEFIVDKYSIRSDIYKRGNASLKDDSWDSPVVNIVVYDKFYEASEIETV
ncbi:MAG: hypothetical protein K6E79_01060 [Pseudobutyrivibrio sp.]|nr:hypothetical protein [Pseudobutyrivibrio sp.]